MHEYTYSEAETPKIAGHLLESIILTALPDHATVVLLQGDLGAGKTSLTQQLGKLLDIQEKMQSPTFGIMKKYSISNSESSFQNLIHIDAYRIENPSELLVLGWKEIIADPKNIVVVEWPELITEILPSEPLFVSIAHAEEQTRKISW